MLRVARVVNILFAGQPIAVVAAEEFEIARGMQGTASSRYPRAGSI